MKQFFSVCMLACGALCLGSGCSSGTTGDDVGHSTGGQATSGASSGGSTASNAGDSNSISGSAGDGVAIAGAMGLAGTNAGGASTGGSTALGGSSGSDIVGAGGALGGAAGASAGSGGTAGGTAAMAGTGGGSNQPPAVDRDATLATIRKVADYYLTQVGTNYKNDWIRSTFYIGLMAAYRTTGDAKYLAATKTWGAANNWKVSTASSSGPRFADNQACFQAYVEVYQTEPTAANAVMVQDLGAVFDSMVLAPKTGRVEWSWVDALFMSPPGMPRAATSLSKPGYVTLMNTMFWDTKAFLFDPQNKLFWRDKNYLNTNTYWARGNGWAIAATARIHEKLPASDTHRADFEKLLKDMSEGLKPWQDATDGMWRSDIRIPTHFTNPESSGTAFFVYGMAYGVHHGILDRATYLPVILKGWNGLLKTALTAEGRIGWTQPVGANPAAATRDSTQDYSVGGFLLAASEVIAL